MCACWLFCIYVLYLCSAINFSASSSSYIFIFFHLTASERATVNGKCVKTTVVVVIVIYGTATWRHAVPVHGSVDILAVFRLYTFSVLFAVYYILLLVLMPRRRLTIFTFVSTFSMLNKRWSCDRPTGRPTVRRKPAKRPTPHTHDPLV